ncbi:hypothetical protein PI172_2431 [Prevotella intermedia]|uniref:Uncharacterized protein n=1 Tax=Prevotella intermedia TaxID=28131 RepID=A0AAD1F8D7_PREIN|nr:hypothetical protein PI172_2431 [Prevotella intermedia]
MSSLVLFLRYLYSVSMVFQQAGSYVSDLFMGEYSLLC